MGERAAVGGGVELAEAVQRPEGVEGFDGGATGDCRFE